MMDLSYITKSLYLILVVVDLIMDKNKKLLPFISLAGLLVAGYFVADQFGLSEFASKTHGAAGMVAVDSFGAFFKLLIIGCIASTIFLINPI